VEEDSMWWRNVIAVLALVAVVGCDDEDPVTVLTGALEVEVATTGEDIDADGYTLEIDGSVVGDPVDPDDTVTFEEVEEGIHDVELTGLASNCSAEGDNPLSVTIEADATETATFAVVCAASG
jgi:hypothetical protein